MLYLDTETYSGEDLKSCGARRYVAHPDFEVLLVSYAIDDDPVRVWDCTNDRIPSEFYAALDFSLPIEGARPTLHILAHNATFDRRVIDTIHQTGLTRWRCSMAACLAHGYPASLDEAGAALGIPQDKAKLKEGKELVRLFCTRRSPRATSATHPDEWAMFVEYARRDVEAMREIWKRLPKVNYR